METADPEGDETGGAPLSRSTSTSSATSAAAFEERYASFRKELKHEQDKEFRTKISISAVLFLIFWLGGSAVFQVSVLSCESLIRELIETSSAGDRERMDVL